MKVNISYYRRVTISDAIERGLKKGRNEEQGCAAQLAPLLCVQLGASDGSEQVYKELSPILTTIINDKSVSPLARSKCCMSLATITFLAGGDIGDVLSLMQQFEGIFCNSYLKGDKSVPNVVPEVGLLHASALNAWTLLFTLMAPGDVYSMFSNGARSFSP